jgi:hypothetical protein
MKFLCLGWLDKEKVDALSKDQLDAVMEQCRPHMQVLYSRGRVIMDAGLEPQTKSLRRRNGKVIVTDGPFAETKEIIGGAFIIEAADLDQAAEIAQLHPTTQVPAGEELGWRLEVRPIHYFRDGTE